MKSRNRYYQTITILTALTILAFGTVADVEAVLNVAVYTDAGVTSILNEASDIVATLVNSYDSATLQNYDVLVNIRNSNLNQADVLNFIQNGGGWVGEWTSNEYPIKDWGVILGSVPVKGSSGSQSVNILMPNHYLAQEIDWANVPVGINPTDYMRDLRGINDPAADIIVTVNHSSYPNNPLLVNKEYGNGRVVLFNWDYQDDPDYNNAIKDMIQEVVRWAALPQIPNDLIIDPPQDFSSSGPEEGPFTPECKTYTLTNVNDIDPGPPPKNVNDIDPGPPPSNRRSSHKPSLDWTATTTQPWLDVTPGGGTLNPSDSNTVEVSINASANILPPGVYNDTVTFTNTTSGIAQTRQVTLEVRVPGVIFCDSFPSTALDSANWCSTAGAPTIDTVGIGEPSPPYSLRLNGYPSGGDSVTSCPINLSGLCGVQLTYSYQRRGGGEHPDPGEDLIFEYWNGSNWEELSRQLGGESDMNYYEEVNVSLPADALHADFKLRIRNIATSGNFDDWFVDDVCLQLLPCPGEIEVTDSIGDPCDSNMPFGDVFVGLSRTEQITITNVDASHNLIVTKIYLRDLPTSASADLLIELPGIPGGSGDSNLSYLPNGWETPERPASELLVEAGYRVLINSADVLLLASGSNPTVLQAGLMAFPDIGAVDYFNCSFAVPTGVDLAPYDVVVVMSDTGFSNATQTGNVLADYVDAGGKVIQAVASFAFGGGWELGGRFVTQEGYEPFVHGGGEFFPHSLGAFNQDHPIMDGVTTLTDSLPVGLTLESGAKWVADWSNGSALVATQGQNVVGINMFVFDKGNFTGDVPRLFHNAVVWLLGAAGTADGFELIELPKLPLPIAPNDHIDVDVVFEPTQAKEYRAEVVIKSNDRDEPEVKVQLSGTGVPDYLDIVPVNDVNFSGHPGGPFVPTYVDYNLTNNGPINISWTVEVNVPWLDISPLSGTLDPCESATVTVSPNAQADLLSEGDWPGDMNFTNITTTVKHKRKVWLDVYTEPKVWAMPLSIDVNVPQGDSETRILTIGNTGGSTLEFTLSGQQTSFTPTAEGQGISSVPPGHDFTMAAADSSYKPGELLVRFAPKANGKQRDKKEKEQILRSLDGGTIKHKFKIVPGLNVVKLPKGHKVKNVLKKFNNKTGILYAQANYKLTVDSDPPQCFPNDPRFDELWGMHNIGQSGGTPDADIDAPEAWCVRTAADGIIVAVIDTGVDYTHPDLAANMWVNEAEFNGTPGVDDDGNGYIDDIYGYDFCNDDGDPWDDHYHGTHCAGTIGAVGNNGIGVAGVCWDVKIMALKWIASNGNGWTDDAIDCVEYSILMGANLSSNSWRQDNPSVPNPALEDVINMAGAAGLLFVASAGNDNLNNDVKPHYPSSYVCENIIAVLSTDKYDNVSSFSNYGPTSVDLGAPGSSILSCEPGNQYQYLSGTSMATPHVAGACALIWSVCPSFSHLEVKDIILQTVDLIPALSGRCVSEGRLNLYEAVLEAQASCGGPPSAWLEFVPNAGTVAAGNTIDVNVVFEGDCNAGTYQGWINISSNDPYEGNLPIEVTMTVEPIDYFTELFDPNYLDPNDPNHNDMANLTLTFRPDGSASYYMACSNEAVSFPVDPNGGTVVSLGDDDYIEVNLLYGAVINFYGYSYKTFYIGSNGYISFTSGDIRHFETLADHFELPRISALFDDLDPSAGGTISWKQLDDCIVVTFENVPEYGLSNSNSFQIEMRFNGKIRITLLDIAADDGLVGLSEGDGLPPYFTESDLSEYDLCTFRGDLNGDQEVDLVDFAIFGACWQKHESLMETVRDEFNAVDYSGNDGSLNWSNSWQELGESDGPSSGLLQVITEGSMRLGDKNAKDQLVRSLTREADLSGATTATLTYDYVVEDKNGDGYVSVQVSGDGGSNWDTLAIYSYDAVSGSESFDITSYISSNTQIRFAIGTESKIKMYLYIDNIQIEYDDPERPWYPWCNGCDFNHDWRIDFNDLKIFCEHWLE